MVESVAVVECRQLEVRRRGHRLLGPIDMSVDRGTLYGIVGPNGAGKSTLLRTIAGLERVDHGTVEVAGGRDRSRVGLLFQHHDFVPEMPFTVWDVVAFGRSGHVRLGPVRSIPDRRMVGDALEMMQLEPLAGRLYRELSGGERQKVQLARLVAQQADLMLLDEPAAGLDLDWQERLTELIGNLHTTTGAAIVMVTHEVHHLPAGCERVLLLRNGRELASGPPVRVLTPELLAELYGCRMEVTERAGRYFAHSLGPTGGTDT